MVEVSETLTSETGPSPEQTGLLLFCGKSLGPQDSRQNHNENNNAFMKKIKRHVYLDSFCNSADHIPSELSTFRVFARKWCNTSTALRPLFSM